MTYNQSNNDDSNLEGPVIKLNPDNVPVELHSLIPYAETWGVRNQELQNRLLDKASVVELENFYKAIDPVLDDIWQIERIYSSEGNNGSYEHGAIGSLWVAFMEVSSILSKKMPLKQWLKLIGWPEKYPGTKIDVTRLPLILHPIFPYIEKWVIDDDAVRNAVLETAIDSELKELVSTIKQIGIENIRKIALEMYGQESQYKESISLMTILDLAEKAEILLRGRE